MDRVTRQVGQHVEFDPEWETAFNLVIKIQASIASILGWCSHDVRARELDANVDGRILFQEDLLLRAYEATGEALADIQKNADVSHLIKDKQNVSPMVNTTVNELKVDCYAYDVAKDPISIHIPVVRLFVGTERKTCTYSPTSFTHAFV